MYVATRELRLSDGKVARAGDVVDEFETWPLVVQRAHLNLEWVTKVDPAGYVKPEPSKVETAPPVTNKKKCVKCGRELKHTGALAAHLKTHKE